MIRSIFFAAGLALCGVMASSDANAQDPRTCPTEFPHPQACIGHNFNAVTLLDNGGDPCESLLCVPSIRPMDPVLLCELEDSGIICKAWPRNPPSTNGMGPNKAENPILYRWEVYGDISGANMWNEDYAAAFRCTAGPESIGVIVLEVMSPYGLTSSTSTPVSCARAPGLDPGESNTPIISPPSPNGPRH